MKNYNYKVEFKNEFVKDTIIYASCIEHASILARAEKIKAGQDSRVKAITKIDYK